MFRSLISCAAGFFIAASVAIANAAELTVFAAASLKDALTELSSAFEKESGNKVIFSFGASSILARQIQEGAPADLIFSADEAKVDELEKKGFVLPGSRKSVLSNTLVIVVAADSRVSISTPADLAKPEIAKLALAETKSVPAGIYAKEHLEKLKLWPQVQSKVVSTENVRAALAAVEAANVEAGIVYKTDALISKKVKIAVEVPAKEGPKISYPLAIIKETRQSEAAKGFSQYIGSAKARSVFEKHGFLVLPSTGNP